MVKYYWLTIFLVTSYLVVISLLIHISCKLSVPRKFLNNLVGEDFIIKYLGHFTSSKLLIKILSPIGGRTLMEVGTQMVGQVDTESQVRGTLGSYSTVFGPDATRWPDKIKFQHLAEVSEIPRLAPRGGIISQAISFAHREEMGRVFTGGIPEVLWVKLNNFELIETIFMLPILNKFFTFLQKNLLSKYLILLLSKFTKLQIQLLNCIEKNNFLYFG